MDLIYTGVLFDTKKSKKVIKPKKPSIAQMKKRPSLWYSLALNLPRIIYSDGTVDYLMDYTFTWTRPVIGYASGWLLRSKRYYVFLGWL